MAKDRREACQRAAFVERVYRQKVYERDGWHCALCHRKVYQHLRVPHPGSATLDHVLPIDPKVGGTHEYRNVQLVHFRCNSRKGNRPWRDGEQLRLLG